MDGHTRPTRNEPIGRAVQNLLEDIKILANDTRELLRQTTGLSGEHFSKLRERTGETLAGIEQHLGPVQHRLAEHGRYVAEVSAAHLRAHRWSTLAAGAAVGFIIAAIIAWRNETPPYNGPEQ